MTPVLAALATGPAAPWVFLALLVPIFGLGVVLMRGFAPGALIVAILRRYLWINLAYVGLIAVAIGIGLALIAQERGLRVGAAAAADKFDMVVTAPGSDVTAMLAAVYLQPADINLVDGAILDQLERDPRVRIAAPLGFGDSHRGAPIVGTTWEFVAHLAGPDFEVAPWSDPFSVIAGADAPAEIGDQFEPAHGVGTTAEEGVHGDILTVTARLPRTGSPWDRALLTPIEGVWLVHGLADGHAPERAGQLGPPFDPAFTPGTPAIIVTADSLGSAYGLQSQWDSRSDTMAFFPGAVLSRLYGVLGDIRQVMSILALVTQVLVAASVLLGLFILTRLFRRQLAMLGALGAPGRFVTAVVWGYAMALLTAGAVLGCALALVAVGAISDVIAARTQLIVPATLGWAEAHAVATFLLVASLVALVPARLLGGADVLSGLRS